ncbi:MAG: SRPBCC domain-containing protein [Phycisphaerales bacterium]
MTADKPKTPATTEHAILITRVFNAPRELVWRAWTQPEHVEKWFGPKGFSTTVEKQELRVGGRSRFVMHGPDGKDYPCEGTYLELVPMERIVTTDEFAEDFENATGTDLPAGIILTVLFEDVGDDAAKTRVTLRIQHPTAEEKKKHEDMGVVGGWNSTLDCLEEQLAAMQA